MSISSSGITSTSAVISWGPPPYEDQNGVISYTISVSVQETGESFTNFINDTTYSFTALKPYRTHDITIAASTSVGTGPFSAVFTVITLEDGKIYIYIFL